MQVPIETDKSEPLVQSATSQPSDLMCTDVASISEPLVQSATSQPSDLMCTDVASISEPLVQSATSQPSDTMYTDVASISEPLVHSTTGQPSDTMYTDVDSKSEPLVHSTTGQSNDLMCTDGAKRLVHSTTSQPSDPMRTKSTDVTTSQPSDPICIESTDAASKSEPLVQSTSSQPGDPMRTKSTDVTTSQPSDPMCTESINVASKSEPLVQSTTSQPSDPMYTDVDSKSEPLVQSTTSQPSDPMSINVASKSEPFVQSTSTQPSDPMCTDVASKSEPLVQSTTTQPSDPMSTDVASISEPFVQSTSTQPVSSTSVTVQCESVSEEPSVIGTSHKARKRRTKGIQKKIQDQIEFYFSDSNLTKDRFMKQRMAEHEEGYVSIKVIADFNRMKALSTDMNIIVQAIIRSSLLELSPDRKMVKRIAPLTSVSQEEIDSRTVYVENLPTTETTNHDSLRKVFSEFGQVTYVSLPKHTCKTQSVLKGFAFVEFSTVDGANRAIEYYKQKSLELAEVNQPSLTESVQPSSTENTDNFRKDAVFVASVNNRMRPCEQNSEATSSNDGSNKRTREENECDDRQTEVMSPHSKKMIIELKKDSELLPVEDDTVFVDTTTDSVTTRQDVPAINKRPREENEGVEETSQRTEDASPNAKKLRTVETPSPLECAETQPERSTASRSLINRKRSRDSESVDLNEGTMKNPRLDSTWSEISAVEDGDDDDLKKKKKTRTHNRKRRDSVPKKLKEMDLRVISKVEWLEIKLLYKKMQKDRMKMVKASHRTTVKPQTNSGGGTYFVSNCLVRVSCNKTEDSEPVTEDSLETFCSKFGVVAYVDFETGAESGFVRFRESGCVKKVVDSEEKMPNVVFEAVSEEEEKGYFIKTKAARRESFKKKTYRTRGLDKIISRAIRRTDAPVKTSAQTLHIRFSDTDDN